MHRFIPLFMILALTACKSIEVGTGDIRLSAQVSRSLDQYLTLTQNPIGFAVTADGQHHSAMVCPSASLCAGNWRADLQRFCERDSNGQPCYILAERKKVVWQGEVFKSAGLDLNATDAVVSYIQPRGVEAHGPKKSTGLILYLPGSVGRDDAQTNRDEDAVPPYVRALGTMGWDVLRGNVADSLRIIGTASRANYLLRQDLTKKLSEIRQQGYSKIVIAGQSAGAAEALELVKHADAEIDAIIAAVPGCCGTRTNQDGTANIHFEENWTYYNKLITGLRDDRRVAVAFFAGDEFEPRDRKDITEQRFASQNIPSFIIHHPGAIRGHSGSWHTAFSYLYAACLNDFLTATETVTNYQCDLPDRPPNNYRWMTQESHLRDSDVQAIPAELLDERFSDKTATTTNIYGNREKLRFDAKDSVVVFENRPNKPTLSYEFDRDMICIDRLGCYRVYEWDAETIIGVSSSGQITFRATI